MHVVWVENIRRKAHHTGLPHNYLDGLENLYISPPENYVLCNEFLPVIVYFSLKTKKLYIIVEL